jgi:hypothetical protein
MKRPSSREAAYHGYDRQPLCEEPSIRSHRVEERSVEVGVEPRSIFRTFASGVTLVLVTEECRSGVLTKNDKKLAERSFDAALGFLLYHEGT